MKLQSSSAGGGEPFAVLHRASSRLLTARRAPVAAAFLLAVSVVSNGIEALSHHDRAAMALLGCAAFVTLNIAQLLIVRRRPALSIIATQTVLCYAALTTCVYWGAVHERSEMLLIILPLLMTGSAAFFPWGARGQLPVSVSALAGYPLALALGAIPTLPIGYEMSGLVTAACVAAVGASLIDQQRRVFESTNMRLKHEITERRQAADALRRNEEQLHDILDYTTAVIYVKDRDGRFLLINRQFEDLFHVRREEVLGKSDYDIFPRPAADAFRENDRLVLASNRPLTFEETAPHDDGLHTYVSIKWSLLDPAGTPYRVCGISTDITARKRMEADLQGSQAQLSALIENTTDMIWSVDHAGRFMAANSPAARGYRSSYGTPLKLGERYDRHMSEEDCAYWQPHYDRVLAGERLRVEREYLIAGVRRSYLISMTPIVTGRRTRGATVFAKDITDIKRAQEQAHSHQAELAHVLRVNTMGEMAAELAHEINQPLGAIANYAQGCRRRIVSEAATPEELLPVIEEIVAAALRAGEIIKRLRQLVQKETPPHAEVDLNEVVSDAVHVITPQARQLGIALRVQLAAELPRIEVDHIQIEQVIVNLILNGLEAMRMTDRAQPEVWVGTVGCADGALQISVQDRGTGLAPAVIERMFDPFYTSKLSGLGMGLTISRSIVERHGGRLWGANNADGGATFHVILPLAPGLAQHPPIESPTAGGMKTSS